MIEIIEIIKLVEITILTATSGYLIRKMKKEKEAERRRREIEWIRKEKEKEIEKETNIRNALKEREEQMIKINALMVASGCTIEELTEEFKNGLIVLQKER